MRGIVFRVRDKDGVPVTLTEDVWSEKLRDPVIGHPEVEPYLEEVRLTIQEPEFVYQSTKDERTLLLYRSGLTKGKTAMLTRSLKKGVMPLWTRENFT